MADIAAVRPALAELRVEIAHLRNAAPLDTTERRHLDAALDAVKDAEGYLSCAADDPPSRRLSRLGSSPVQP